MAEPKVGADVVGALTLAGILTLIALAAENSALGIVITIVDFLLIVFCMSRVPVRQSMIVLMFFVFALPNPAEGQPTAWEPPFTIVGRILLNHLNTVDRSIGAFAGLSFSGLDLLLVALSVITLVRRSTGSRVDSVGRLATPKPLITLALVSMGSTAFVWLSGLVRGGDFGMSLWQVNCVIYLPVLFLLFQSSFRGPQDHRAIARALLAAATYKCGLALLVTTAIKVPMDPETGSTRPAYATSHNDSLLFSVAFMLILALLLERQGKAKRYALIFLPILAVGTWANNRRLAWVQVALVFLTVYIISRESPIKRKIRRALLALTPVLAVYIVLGWSSSFGTLFKPVRMIRSVVDARSDGSSLWRELENVNLIGTFRENPLFGLGYGHPYKELVVLPEVDYPLERYTPHNSLLGLWSYCGLFGFATLTLFWVGGVYFAMRSYHKTKEPAHRAAALVSFGAVLSYLLQSWGDLGLGSFTGVFMMSTSITVAGKLAVANGQWGARAKRAPKNDSAAASNYNVHAGR